MSAEETFEERLTRVRVYVDPRCDRCDAELEFHTWQSVNDPNPGPEDTSPWYSHAMKVRLHGSYGGYIDETREYDLCARCSHALFTFLDQSDDDPLGGDAEWVTEARLRVLGPEVGQ